MPGEDIQSWSTVASNNDIADSLINWREGQPRASVNDSARSLMAAHAKNRDLQSGKIVTTGTANAQAFVSGVGYTTVPTGLRVLLKIGAGLTNTAATTLNMDGIGDVATKNQAGKDFVGGELADGSYCEFVYDGTNWILLDRAAGLVLIEQIITPITPVAAAKFVTNIDGTFDAYLFTLTDIVADTDDAALCLEVSEDLGVTWKNSGGNYRWATAVHLDSPPSTANFGDSSTAFRIPLTQNSMSSFPQRALSGSVRMFNPASTTAFKKFQFDAVYIGSGGGSGRWTGSGIYWATTNPINGVQFLMSSGNIASGTIRMYGLAGA